jgi:anti-anti-sigma factor
MEGKGNPGYDAIHLTPQSTLVICFAEGSLTYKTAPDLMLRLNGVVGQQIADGCRHVVLDFTRIHLIDSSGVTLVSAMRNLVAPHGTLQLCALRPHVVKIFELLGLTRQLCIRASREEALASIEKEPPERA